MKALRGKAAAVGTVAACGLVVLFAATACSSAPEGRSVQTADSPPSTPQEASVPPSGGAVVPEPAVEISLDLTDVDLHQALQALSRRVGVNIVADPDVKEKVTVHLDQVSWRKALDVIARQAKCTIVTESERLIRLTQPPSISMEFQDADITVVLQLLAKQAGVNVIFGSDIQGKVTLNLREVPWMDAFEAVVKTAGYVVVREGNWPSPTSLRVTRPW